MTGLPCDSPVDLHLLLGKALREGTVTKELIWRVWSFFNELYSYRPLLGYHLIQIVSGGGGEAIASKELLNSIQATLCMPRVGGIGGGEMFLETESPNSRLNIAFAHQKVRQKGFRGRIRLTLHSSGYHTDSLLELRYKLPSVSPFSFITEPNAILDVYAKPAPYLYPVCGIKELEWLAEIYLLRQHLRFVWENIRGISGVAGSEEERISLGIRKQFGLIVKPNTVGEFFEESVARITNSLERAQVLLDDCFEPTGRFKQRVEQAREHLRSFLEVVKEHEQWLCQHQGPVCKGDLREWANWATKLELFFNPTHVGDFDPDTEGILLETYGARPS